jgi:hypothetical protein
MNRRPGLLRRYEFSASCTSCHREFRDTPLGAKPSTAGKE